MKNKVWIWIVVLVLVVGVCAMPAFAEEDGDGMDEIPAEPVPTVEPEQTQEPEQPTDPPVVETQTPQPTETAGQVDLTIYAYHDGAPAEGYTVQIDAIKLAASGDGKVMFPGVTVEQHNIKLIDKNGNESVGVLYMSRADGTSITDKAMGGKYGVNVARGATQLYFNIHFNKQSALDIDKLSDKAPSPLPKPSSSTEATQEPQQSSDVTAGSGVSFEFKTVAATFLDEAGETIEGMDVKIQHESGVALDLVTSNKGVIRADGVPYGTVDLSFGREVAPLTLTMRSGVQTGLLDSSENAVVISAAPGAKQIHVEFQEEGGRFVVKSVSEDAPGMSMYMVGVIAVIVIVAVVIIIASVRTAAKKKRYEAYKEKEMQRAQPREEEPMPRRTGGANKMENKSNNKFDDRSRM